MGGEIQGVRAFRGRTVVTGFHLCSFSTKAGVRISEHDYGIDFNVSSATGGLELDKRLAEGIC
jgi:hypothetical protein